MFIVQYPMRFGRLPRHISNPYSAPLCVDGMVVQLTQLRFMHYPLNITK